MGDAVMKTNTDRNFRRGIIVALAAAVLAWGCASAKPEASASAPASSTQTSAAPAASTQPAPAEISRLEVSEAAPGARIEIGAQQALVWTTFRDADGNLVVELPNSRPSPDLTDQTFDSGLVSSVHVSGDGPADRPLTRVVIATRERAEHRLDAESKGLRIDLVPSEEPAQAASAPAAQPAAPAAEATPASAAPASPSPATLAAAGTPDQPAYAPAPTGAPATRLEGFDRVADSTIRIAGNGEFAYSTFRLENPERFVIDLEGVINATDRGTLPVDEGALARVRVSQFRTQPEPVSRVVFDLNSPTVPSIERTDSGLLVRFGDAAATAVAAAAATTPAAPTPAAETAQAPAATTAPAADAPTPAAAAPAAATSDVEAYAAPAATATAPAAPAAPAASKSTGSVSDFEAADVQPAVGMAKEPAPESPTLPSIAAGQTLTGAKKQYFGEPISLDLRDADVREVLRSFAKISGLNVVIQPGVKGTVTVSLDSVPWDQALDIILKTNSLGYELEGNIMRVAPISVLQNEAREAQKLAQAQALSIPLRTVVKRLSYSTAGEVAALLRQGGAGGILSQRGTVIIDARTNTLIIKELPNFIDTVLAVIDTLDVPEPQVMIEAKIIETTKEFSRSLGVSWGFNGVADAAHGNSTGLEFPNHGTIDGGVGLLTGGANGFVDLSLGNVLDTFTLNARLQAAESEGMINVLSAPKIATLNNNPASIQSGVQLPIQTVANNTVTVQFVNATLRLDVTPHVTAEGTILMDINVQKREPQLAFVVPGAANAPIATKEARTRVIVRDGGTTVIGGIYKVTTDQGQDRVPGLSHVPLLGHLFKNRRTRNSNDELLIFITPRVIKL
jgi:type IV pilus secretin PilQ/predicted competence protein